MQRNSSVPSSRSAASMREASPYIRSHRGQTFVVYFGGRLISDLQLDGLAQDLILLAGLGIKVVVVHGARPQIDARTRDHNMSQQFVGELRVTDARTLAHVKDAVSTVRIDIEARLQQAARDTPDQASAITVSGGNFVIARPAGIVDGVDLPFTGVVRKIDREAIERRLDADEIVIVSPTGYSATGEVFNLNALDLSVNLACDVNASKLILMMDSPGLVDNTGSVIRELSIGQARNFSSIDPAGTRFLESAIRACQFGVRRVHLIDGGLNGALLEELFTRDGSGTLLSNAPSGRMRHATIDDVGGVLALIEPLERDGLLVKRSRAKLEIEIDQFSVLIREGVVAACGAIYPFEDNSAELACIAVHPDHRGDALGNIVLEELERRAHDAGLTQVFVLTTHASHWFQESGYDRAEIDNLPIERQALYNYQRNSIVLVKGI
jgi:amino-acid N-acetyltransferase